MADTKISALTALTGANLASTDEAVVVDKSDTTMSVDGTDKKMTATELAAGLARLAGSNILISTQTLGSDAAQIDFSSIPGTYKGLRIVGLLRTDRASTADGVKIRVGSGSLDTASNYRWMASIIRVGTTDLDVMDDDDDWIGEDAALNGFAAGSTAPSGYFLPVEVWLPGYADTAKQRVVSVRSSYQVVGSAGVSDMQGVWENTANAIDTIRFAPVSGTVFVTGSTLALYGVP